MCIFYMHMQVGVSSISKAQPISNACPQLESILVGGKRYMPLSTPDLQSVFALLDTMHNPLSMRMCILEVYLYAASFCQDME